MVELEHYDWFIDLKHKSCNVKILWDELKGRYCVANGYEIKLAIHNCKQKGQEVATYYSCLKKLWDKLINEQIPLLDSKEVAVILSKSREEEKFGLDSQFKNIRSNILNDIFSANS